MRKIGLIDVDSHNFPNLALMKISAFHKSKGDQVEFVNFWDKYDMVYMSKVFSFSKEPKECIQSNEIIKGGTGYNLENKLSNEIEKMCPDYSLYHQYTYAVGFLSRGCSRNCPFCIVNKKEGSSHKVADLNEFYRGQKEIKLLDPNILECKESDELLNQLIDSKAYVDFTQGLDIRLINKLNIKQLKSLKLRRIHFAYDRTGNQSLIEKNLEIFKNETGFNKQKVSVYILVNFETTIEEDLYRIDFVKRIGFQPYIMIYDKDKLPSNSIYKQLQRYVNSPRIFWSCSLIDYLKSYSKTHKNYFENIIYLHGNNLLKTIGA